MVVILIRLLNVAQDERPDETAIWTGDVWQTGGLWTGCGDSYLSGRRGRLPKIVRRVKCGRSSPHRLTSLPSDAFRKRHAQITHGTVFH